ncbi:1,3-propanediol dehydrogenase [Botrimarina colliarenosi]|uniref:1,3-propanediol dehydrogenase n=1 Tax=Botrimarina colliarenosi TaxID=2528001 RepID=A0A5C6AFT4_9BACT|nr:iron-containing alcohol dehydrogenase [Botrimarina colliarenosi]TWT97073.1 1,3-propanediol dehydrogenase [Botrimarina colliarenosi]
MPPFDFNCPTRIVFGPGRVAELGALTAGLGVRRAMLVSDPGIIQAGHTGRCVELLGAAGIEALVFDGVQENPTTDNVERGVEVAKEYQPDVIVAVGGGSSMDCSKGINFVHSCGGRMQDYWGVGKATGPMLPMVAVPTTSGTGSEAQSFALISDATTHTKMACGDKRAAFRLAVLDPELTLTQPQRVTALTGVDALSHTVETLVTKKRNQVSMAFSREAWRLLSQGLPCVLEDPADRTARGWVQQGACLAGLAIENSMLGAAHALANPLTAVYGVVHGEAVGLMLSHVVRHNAASDEGCRIAYGELDDDLPGRLASITFQAGLAGRLGELGVERSRLPQLAADAARQWTGTFNPVEMGEDDYLRLYEAAF